jgi:hypothetical protein
MSSIALPGRERGSLLVPLAWAWIVFLVALALFLPGELAGWLLVAISYLLVIALGMARRSPYLGRVLLLTVTLGHLVSLANVYVAETYIGAGDAETFHQMAVAGASSASRFLDWAGQTDSRFYVWLLTRWYMLFGAHLLVGQSLGILAFLGASVFAYRIARLLGRDAHQAAGVVLLMGLLPSALMFNTVTLREPLKIFFMTLLLYASLRYFENPSNLLRFVIWVLSGLSLALLHNGFGPLLPILFVLPYLLLPSISVAWRSSGLRFLILVVSLVAAVGLAYNLLGTQGDLVPTLTSGDILAEAEQARAMALYNEGRATYGVALDTSSLGGLGATSLLAYVGYLAAPFPWQIRSLLDVYGFVDVLIGLIFLAASLWAYRQEADRQRKKKILYLLAVFFVVSFVHALGTANYGTSIRHRQLTTWILFVVGWPQVTLWLRRRSKNRRPSSP